MMGKIYWKLWIEWWCFRAWLKGSSKDKYAWACDWLQGETQPESIEDISVIGDSSANHFAHRLMVLTPATNFARNGAVIDDFTGSLICRLDHKTVVLMIGGNNIGLLDEDFDTIIRKHFNLYKSIQAQRKIVVGLSPVNGTEGFSPVKNSLIHRINNRLSMIYGKEFIDTFPPAMLPSFTDGVHHTNHYDQQIIQALKIKLERK